MNKRLLICLFIAVAWVSCQKAEPYNSADNVNFNTPYCNDPEAVNYNDGFPGVANNSICFYPRDVFEGSYLFKDSILNAQFELDTVLEYTIGIFAYNKRAMGITGFCTGDTILVTGDRYYKASVDSLFLPDSSRINGQLLCRGVDTLSGTLAKIKGDSTRMRINWTIASDTGVNYHIGTAEKL